MGTYDLTKIMDKCPQCGEHLWVNKQTTLTSYPAQYNTQCKNCDYHGYVRCDDVNPYKDKKPSGVTVAGCFYVFSIVFMLIMFPIGFWLWVQFIKFCNYLIECGW